MNEGKHPDSAVSGTEVLAIAEHQATKRAQLRLMRPSAHDPADRRQMPLWTAIIVAVICGGLMATQAKVNGELAARLNNGFAAAFISFGSGLCILLVLVLVLPAGRRGISRLRGSVRARRIPLWTLLGGCGGAVLVLSQSLTSSLVGLAMFSVAVIGGQTLSGLLLDRLGLAPGGRRPLTTRRIIGAMITVAAVAISLSTRIASDTPVILLVMPFIAGAAIAWQQAVNGRVSVAAKSVLTSTFLNFATGTLALAVVLATSSARTALPSAYPSEWWLYVGGMIGVIFIFGLASAVQVTGVLLLGLGTVAGQLLASIILDVTLPHSNKALDVVTLCATVIVFAAVVLASPLWSRRSAL